MFKKGFTVREIKEIFRFIDILLELEDAEKEQLIYEYARKSQKGEYEMVITPLERIAMEKGMEKGKIEAAKKLSWFKSKLLNHDNFSNKIKHPGYIFIFPETQKLKLTSL